MTVTAAGPNANLLRMISFADGRVNVEALSKDQANELLAIIARDSLTSGGNIKSGYFRVLTDKSGHITEIGRSSVSSKGRDVATDLIKALTEKACGADSAEVTALNTYLDKSGQKVGSKSLVKLIGARAARGENSPPAGALLEGSNPDGANAPGGALARYMQRIQGRLNDDSTGRLRLPDGQGRSSAQLLASPRASVDSDSISESSDTLAARVSAMLRVSPAPKPDFVKVLEDLVSTWELGRNESQLEATVPSDPDWYRELKFPINCTALKDFNRGAVEHEPGKLRYVRADSNDNDFILKKNSGAKAAALNGFMGEWQTALGESAAQNLSRNLTRFVQQGAFAMSAEQVTAVTDALEKEMGAGILISGGRATDSITVESQDDQRNLRITVRVDWDPVVATNIESEATVTLDQVWKSHVSFTVPVDALTREDFDPSCLKVVSADWGFSERA